MPKTDTAKLLVEQAVSQLRVVSATLAALRNETQSLAASLPERPVAMGMFGVGPARPVRPGGSPQPQHLQARFLLRKVKQKRKAYQQRKPACRLIFLSCVDKKDAPM